MKNEKIYTTLDSGTRTKYDSGFQRDTNEGKPRFDLIPTEPLTRLADLYERGARKYGDSNWRLANTEEEIARFKQSAWRHFVSWSAGDDSEDHAAAVMFNLMGYMWHTEYKTIDKLNKI